ncbi:MAG: AMP-binding protein, partial [Alphaproteobacteria bacterium]|nr:AMP-binding protein [Alphaproteobacteria bacterium]
MDPPNCWRTSMQFQDGGDAVFPAPPAPNRVSTFTFVESDGSETQLFPERESGRIQAIAAVLADRIPRGAPIGLLYRSEPNLVVNWLACLHAGLQPLIMQYPTKKQNRKYWSDSVADTTLTVGLGAILSDDYCASLGIGAIVRVIHQRELDTLPPAAPGPLLPEAFEIIQLSSGTTGYRKALRYTKHELERHVEAYNAALSLTSDDRLVSWLPLYHDMGYVACFVMPLLLGIDIVMMEPMAWVQRPELLFDVIEKHRGTVCYMPNFGYEVMARLAPRTLPLMRRWVSAGEPVSPSTVRKFLHATGADPDTFAPLYGMAENIFAITLGRGCSTLSLDGVEVISCGRPIPGVEVKAVDGELWVRSPTMPPSYLDGKDIRGPDGFFPSGDLGQVVDGAVYVCGRKRDLLIQAGRKFMLSDIDLRLNELRPDVRGRAAALAIHDERLGTEVPTILIEAPDFFQRTDAAEIATELKERTGLEQIEVAFVPPRFLTKTSSGKINRRISGANWLAVKQSQNDLGGARRDPVGELRASFWAVAWDRPISEVLDSLSLVILGIALDGTHVAHERHWTLNDIAAALQAEATAEQPTVRDTIRIVSLADYGTIWHVSEAHLNILEQMLGCKVTFEHVCLPPSAIILSDLIFRDYFQPRLDQAPFVFVDRTLAKLKGASILLIDDMAEMGLLDGLTFCALSHNCER